MPRTITTAVALPAHLAGRAAVRLSASPDTWWPDGAARLGGGWQGQVRLGRLRRPVLVVVDAPWVEGDSTSRGLRWTPLRTTGDGGVEPDPRLPGFRGSLVLRGGAEGLRDQSADEATLILRGRYDPPGGWVGNALDSVVLRAAAARTAQALLADIAGRLVVPREGGADAEVASAELVSAGAPTPRRAVGDEVG